MTILGGVDSAFGPSLTSAQMAKADGITFWFGYLGGPGAYHQWMPGEWDVLRQVGLIPGALWVPTMGLTENPVVAARQAVAQANMEGLYGAIMLDTENGMRSVPTLESWVDGFVATVNSLGRACPVYSGAGYVPAGTPSFAPNWGSSVYPTPGQAVQYGPATAYGMSVDRDLADSAFPFASFTPPGPPPPVTPVPGVTVASFNDPQEGAMKILSFTIQVAEGYGWLQTSQPWSGITGAAPALQGLDPAADGIYLTGSVQMQDRNNAVFLTLTGCGTTPEATPSMTPAPFSGKVTVLLQVQG